MSYLPPDNSVLQQIVRDSFITEINALKPGNVSRYADGHGMTWQDFLDSAILVTPILCDPRRTLGQRILDSVQITRERIGTNTNLGMILLFTPLVMAAEENITPTIAALRYKLQDVLSAVDKADSRLIFQAIMHANPGGLGHSDRFDIRYNPDCTLLDAMLEAGDRDTIARQFSNGFNDIFTKGLGVINDFTLRWNSVEWATVACYLTYLSATPDSHVARKYGVAAAEQVMKKAAVITERFKKLKNPGDAVAALLEFDRDLKVREINPGTSADLAAAGVLLYKLAGRCNLKS